jgi:hypothetical protein
MEPEWRTSDTSTRLLVYDGNDRVVSVQVISLSVTLFTLGDCI